MSTPTTIPTPGQLRAKMLEKKAAEASLLASTEAKSSSQDAPSTSAPSSIVKPKKPFVRKPHLTDRPLAHNTELQKLAKELTPAETTRQRNQRRSNQRERNSTRPQKNNPEMEALRKKIPYKKNANQKPQPRKS